MELLTRLSWVDLAVIAALAAGVFFGFTQGLMRYLLNSVAVVVAFVLAAQLKGPFVDLLGFWDAFTPEGRELLVFNILFIGFVIGAFLTIRVLYKRSRLPIWRQLDELGGAVLGLLFVALVITFELLVLDSYFVPGNVTGGWVGTVYEALNDSILVEFFRDVLVPTAGFMARPFVPSEIARLLER